MHSPGYGEIVMLLDRTRGSSQGYNEIIHTKRSSKFGDDLETDRSKSLS